MPVGAEPVPEGGVSFRVWAPEARRVEVALEGGGTHRLEPDPGGYFRGVVDEAGPGSLYRYRLDGGPGLPDPASRFQPSGPSGPSEVVDPDAYEWSDGGWRGVEPAERVLYEMHVGTFTRRGTFRAAATRLAGLRAVGVTLIQLMPVAEFPGAFGWGYDGVLPYAPTRLYGRPDDFRAFVDRAHALGMGVMLDVVYNHLGATGDVLGAFSGRYFSSRHETDWGPCLNFDGEGSRAVREYAVENAAFWIREYRLDGLRLDAVDEIHDESEPHVVDEIVRRTRAEAAPRRLFLAAESQLRDTSVARAPEEGGRGVDALYNEDFHHAMAVALTGRAEGDLGDYRGTPQEIVSLALRGLLYQGQPSRWLERSLGSAADDLGAGALVNFLENHDQVANSVHGKRLHQLVGEPLARAATAVLLLSPGVPMLFQGQERFAGAPFLFFADKDGGDGDSVRRGRADFLGQYPSLGRRRVRRRLPDPCDPDTFALCTLDPAADDGGRGEEARRLHGDLLAMRISEPAFREAARPRVAGAVLGPAAFVLRFEAPEGRPSDRRLLLVNLGRQRSLVPAAEPLLAPPGGFRWEEAWSSEWPRYGGGGNPPVVERAGWRAPARCAVVLRPIVAAEESDGREAP